MYTLHNTNMTHRQRQVNERIANYYIEQVHRASRVYNDPAVQRSYAAGRIIRLLADLALSDNLVLHQLDRALERDSG